MRPRYLYEKCILRAKTLRYIFYKSLVRGALVIYSDINTSMLRAYHYIDL